MVQTQDRRSNTGRNFFLQFLPAALTHKVYHLVKQMNVNFLQLPVVFVVFSKSHRQYFYKYKHAPRLLLHKGLLNILIHAPSSPETQNFYHKDVF